MAPDALCPIKLMGPWLTLETAPLAYQTPLGTQAGVRLAGTAGEADPRATSGWMM